MVTMSSRGWCVSQRWADESGDAVDAHGTEGDEVHVVSCCHGSQYQPAQLGDEVETSHDPEGDEVG